MVFCFVSDQERYCRALMRFEKAHITDVQKSSKRPRYVIALGYRPVAGSVKRSELAVAEPRGNVDRQWPYLFDTVLLIEIYVLFFPLLHFTFLSINSTGTCFTIYKNKCILVIKIFYNHFQEILCLQFRKQMFHFYRSGIYCNIGNCEVIYYFQLIFL